MGADGRQAATNPKTSFQFDQAGQRAKCVAAVGRLEIKFDRDFSAIDRQTLEQAVMALIDALQEPR